MSTRQSHGAICFWLLSLIVCAGCTSHTVRLRDARNAFFVGDLARADSLLDKASSYQRERDCLLLDQAVVRLVDGKPREAEAILRAVRDRFDHLEQNDTAESLVSLLTDDTQRAYAGEDYEKVMIRSLLAVSSLMQDGADAVPYCLQVEQKQRELIEAGCPGETTNPKLQYRQVAIGTYLLGVVQEETHRNYDDAVRAFASVASWEPSFRLARYDAERARVGVHSTRGNGVVYVLAFVGRGPYKEEFAAEATSDALLVADRILSVVGDHTLPPTIAPVKIPRVVVPRNTVDAVAVDVDQRPAGLTETVTDVGLLALTQYEATKRHTIARAVARRAVKKAAVYSTKNALAVDDGLTNLAFDAAGVVWEATEAADTRCWGLLPEKIQVLRLELPAGNHSLTLRAAHNARPIGPPASTTISIIDGRNTYVLACFPRQKLAGKLCVSRSAP